MKNQVDKEVLAKAIIQLRSNPQFKILTAYLFEEKLLELAHSIARTDDNYKIVVENQIAGIVYLEDLLKAAEQSLT